METVEQYKKQKLATIKTLKRLQNFIENGEKFGLDNQEYLKEKINKAIEELQTDRLKVSLVGGFSEGKTSIAAAWSGKYDPKTMKIDISESSDEIQIYKLEDFDLIDTPGLFGFKELNNKTKYKEITRKYISETNLLLYVMNPNNPIKDSHKEELRWLFKELDLLSRSVFVISRFDEEVDIEDEVEYKKSFNIKKQSIYARLRDFDIIDDSQEVSVVAVSADPFGEGMDYWLSNIEEYHMISHIKDLQQATLNKIKESGGKELITIVTAQSIIKDIIKKEIPNVEKNIRVISNEIDIFKATLLELVNQKEKIEKRINTTIIELKEYITQTFTDLIIQARGTDMETIEDFFERNIGDEGIVLETNIQNEFSNHIDQVFLEISKTATNFESSINHYNSLVGDLAIKGLKESVGFMKNVSISSSTILSTRDVLMPALKFKPWGAIKLANNLTKGIPVVGAILEIGIEFWDSYNQLQKEEKFNEVKDSIIANLKKQRQEYLELISNKDEFIKCFFTNYIELSNQLTNLEKEVNDKQDFKENFEKWKLEAAKIESDF